MYIYILCHMSCAFTSEDLAGAPGTGPDASGEDGFGTFQDRVPQDASHHSEGGLGFRVFQVETREPHSSLCLGGRL